jgi:predicted CoA-substrate-specific enzyme activase
MRTTGIDVGSLTTKGVVLQGDTIQAFVILPSADEAAASARSALEELKRQYGIDGDFFIVATGMGGKAVDFAHQQKSITTCLARGVHFLYPEAKTAIDMGVESSTVIKINQMGKLVDWANHDKCASGTGIFLQQMAKLMQVSMEEMSDLSMRAAAPADISNTCAIFAESEVISHVHRDPPTPMADLAAGIYLSVVSRIMALCKRIGVQKEVAVSGGVALNKGLVKILEKEIGYEVLIPNRPQIIGALGAAIIARDTMDGKKA